MLELKDVCFSIQKDGEPINLIDNVSIDIPRGHFMAIVGPSGCGKTTLLKTIAGLNEESAGDLIWNGRNLAEEKDFDPAEIGYVPQFSIAYDQLTVDESIESATRLRVKTRNVAELDNRIDRILEETGLATLADRPVKVLSGGQKRRLGLAMELVTGPHLLLCDEVTSGLDPRSERDIVRLLHQLSRKDGRSVISVTHSLAHLELYDSILVLHEGRVAYHGPPEGLTHYFSVDDMEEVYPQLAKQRSDKWQSSWLKHREAYYGKLEAKRQKQIEEGTLSVPDDVLKQKMSTSQALSEKLDEEPKPRRKKRSKSDTAPLDDPAGDDAIVREATELVPMPGVFSQFSTLLSRRWKIFFRDRGQVFLQLSILVCFPILVALFSDRGNENIKRFSDRQEGLLQQITEESMVKASYLSVGSAVSGIVMFQVVLLSLMGSNNSAREVAGERLIFEKEKFGGIRPSAYLASKVAFLGSLILIQSLWMAIFVQQFWKFPDGTDTGFLDHTVFLVMVNAAMTFVCLGISSLMKTAEQSSLLSIYLVGFQLPLSGAVLALPESIESITRPFISAYWAWSGSIDSMNPSYRNAIDAVTETSFQSADACHYLLAIHIALGLIASYIGLKRHQWD
ncbi:ATP-binding cassette domain-containing protein [Verrucomicrobiaceae bacterium R5-34]|uniref:ATP-binding cassette domain-containing protein n=1 Tax=Oceaniferula flava TaxID=2800421 RepID=A0AAE2SDR8_9BACT|nr:ATP-binding cassette domain-containing protein [Oceaniferula flavus]MBK1829856.1 ATP-binding cassette domain-containing protein [Verrucomicrobiaceae bacterium R5-34]MBK1856325.1 ATP-binding cassette domain-containing protein [Oceaniferula flavus]MBM1137632.1 ATP-binding cassette domain-containing protein [Oceaniferula flavus]